MAVVIIVKSDFDRFEEWQREFARHDIEAIPWDQRYTRASDISYALVWHPEPGSLGDMPNLRVIFSVGAGVDHLKGENLVPEGIPVVRMVEDALTSGMVEYVVYNTLHFHRKMPAYVAHQQENRWQFETQIPAWDRSVGILGLGVLGSAAAVALKQLQFNVSGWSRSEKNVEGVRSFYGMEQLPSFLSQTEILVCLLPLTSDTREIINASTIRQLPKGAWLINAGRGPLVNEEDLLQALDEDYLSGAALDVFHQEPLTQSHRFWNHPKVLVTPHVASITLPPTSAKHVVENIRLHESGGALTHVADMKRGY